MSSFTFWLISVSLSVCECVYHIRNLVLVCQTFDLFFQVSGSNFLFYSNSYLGILPNSYSYKWDVSECKITKRISNYTVGYGTIVAIAWKIKVINNKIKVFCTSHICVSISFSQTSLNMAGSATANTKKSMPHCTQQNQ